MKLYKKLLKRIEDGNPIYCNETFAKDLEAIANKHFEQLLIQRVSSSNNFKNTLVCKEGRIWKLTDKEVRIWENDGSIEKGDKLYKTVLMKRY